MTALAWVVWRADSIPEAERLASVAKNVVATNGRKNPSRERSAKVLPSNQSARSFAIAAQT